MGATNFMQEIVRPCLSSGKEFWPKYVFVPLRKPRPDPSDAQMPDRHPHRRMSQLGSCRHEYPPYADAIFLKDDYLI